MAKLNEAIVVQELKARPDLFPALTYRGLLSGSPWHFPSYDAVPAAHEELGKGAADPTQPLLDQRPLPSPAAPHPDRVS